jgi:NAD(P)-dependent dehydrogenase (short-subunit alcohol dehydrogenase family)
MADGGRGVCVVTGGGRGIGAATARRAAADGWTAEGIRVNAVRPGIIDTEIHASAGNPDRPAQVGPQIPLGRAGTADEVAATIVWLLGDEASYVTGSIIDVAGGR